MTKRDNLSESRKKNCNFYSETKLNKKYSKGNTLRNIKGYSYLLKNYQAQKAVVKLENQLSAVYITVNSENR